MTTSEILAAFPTLTYRQLDHWVTAGYVRPRKRRGWQRHFTDREVAILRVMLALVADGVKPARAVQIARDYLGGKQITIGGFRLVDLP